MLLLLEVEVPLTIVRTFSNGCAGGALDEGFQLVGGGGGADRLKQALLPVQRKGYHFHIYTKTVPGLGQSWP